MPGERYDVLVLGGGSAGCVLASRLSEDEGRTVCLVEAGPDYGPYGSGAWPEDMLDARLPPDSHNWRDADGTLPVARIIGGCSAHNMCTLMHGAPADYDGWADISGDPRLAYDEFSRYLGRAEGQMTRRLFADDELDPWVRGVQAAAEELGLPVHENVNDPEATVGVGRVPFNLEGTTRWNTGFAYLDPARGRPNLTVISETDVDRLTFDGESATGAEVVGEEGRRMLHAGDVVVAGGAYGTPAILLRSGIGPEEDLRALGIEVRAALPVGEGLCEHFGIPVRFAPTEAMAAELADHRARMGDPSIQGVMRVRTDACPDNLWDLHLLLGVFPIDPLALATSSMLLQARWRGSVALSSTDPAQLPRVTTIDWSGEGDLEAAFGGVEFVRRLVATDALRDRVAEELAPGADASERQLRESGRKGMTNYFHPVGTCAMGSVTDGAGRVLGFEGLRVVDASAVPRPLRASPHLTVLALAERQAELI